MENILLLHGAIGAKDQLQPLSSALSSNYKIHALNFSGHGGTPFSEKRFSIPVFADEVINYIQENELEPLNIFGYSMGGYVAMHLAKHHPQSVNKIVTLATKFYWDEEIAAKEIKMLDADTLLQKVRAFAEQLKKRHEPNDWKIVLEKTRDMLIGLGKQNALNLEDYKTISKPALLLLGEKDKMVSVDETGAVATALVNGKFQSLPATPHPVEQVDKDMLAGIISDFLK